MLVLPHPTIYPKIMQLGRTYPCRGLEGMRPASWSFPALPLLRSSIESHRQPLGDWHMRYSTMDIGAKNVKHLKSPVHQAQLGNLRWGDSSDRVTGRTGRFNERVKLLRQNPEHPISASVMLRDCARSTRGDAHSGDA